MKIMLGKKLHMTREFKDDGTVLPVTIVDVASCTVTQVRPGVSGMAEVQLGINPVKRLGKARAGHLKGVSLMRTLRTFRVPESEGASFERGAKVSPAVFAVGDMVAVTGTSIGKGFAGVMKRHGFKGHPATHGHKDSHRAPGSIGAGGVQRVFKGMRMAGRMGGERVTVKSLEVVKIDEGKGLLYLKGAVPGARNGIVMLKGAK